MFLLMKFTYSGITMDTVNATMVTTTVIVVLFTTLVCQLVLHYWMNPTTFTHQYHLPQVDEGFTWHTQVFGFLTKPLILYLVPHTPTQETKSPKDDLTLPMLSMDESAATNLSRAKDSLSMLIERPVHTIHSYWRKFDDAYMRPLFGGPVDSQRR